MTLPVLSDAGTIRATLTFQDNSADETGFRIERKAGAGVFVTLATLAPGVTSLVDSPLGLGETYCYRIVAVNAVGESAPSNEACAQVPDVPGAPSNVTLVIQVVP